MSNQKLCEMKLLTYKFLKLQEFAVTFWIVLGVPGADVWCLVSGVWCWCLVLVPGAWCLVPGVWCVMTDAWCLVLVSGAWFLVSGVWCLVSGAWCLMPDA
jgi:hypothetical protein